MSQSFLSVACAGLLLAAGALAATDAVGPAASEALAPVPVPVSASAAAAHGRTTHAVHVLVTLRDASGKVVAKPAVRIEGEDAVDIGVGPDGAKLSLPVNASANVRVLFPGGNCGVALSPKAVAGGSVMIVVDKLPGGPRCAIGDATAVASAASAASAASGAGGTARDKHGSLLDGLL
jgi:hypothetical protein